MPKKPLTASQQSLAVPILEQACHTFALSGDQTGKRDINGLYDEISNDIGAKYDYGIGISDEQRVEARNEAMKKIKTIADPPLATVPDLYLCGGFREGQVCPEHLWLEDRTHNVTYDTFIDRPVIRKNGVGIEGQPFQPGCESHSFEANDIVRLKVKGYTRGQYLAIKEAVLVSDYFATAGTELMEDDKEVMPELEKDPRLNQQQARVETEAMQQHGLFRPEKAKVDGEKPAPAAGITPTE